MKREDVKVGSIWKGESFRFQVKEIKGDEITCVILEAPSEVLVGKIGMYSIPEFIKYFKPVYIVEGFEV